MLCSLSSPVTEATGGGLKCIVSYKGSWLPSGLLLSFGCHLALLSGLDDLACWNLSLLDDSDAFLPVGAGCCDC